MPVHLLIHKILNCKEVYRKHDLLHIYINNQIELQA